MLDASLAANMFYQVLSAKLGDFNQLFPHVKQQEKMFETALVAMANLDENSDELMQQLEIIGEKHKGIGLTADHLTAGREAFQHAIAAGGIRNKLIEIRYMNAFDTIVQAMKILT